jgi:xanthine/CO dehydrogenase XdhC/CoxF family maturation factor
MIITKKALPRRTFLRTVGASMALPMLDAMIPAATAASKTPLGQAKRLGFIFMPMGCDQSRWTPGSEGDLSKLSPILDSLAPVRDQLSVLTNMELANAYPGSHATSNSSFLSAAKARHTEGNDYYLGTTVDQVAAKQLGQHTQLPSLELSMDLMQNVGQCDNGYACVYQNNLSWSTPTTPLPAEAHPRLVFESLFGEGGSTQERQEALKQRASLLDAFRQDVARLKRELIPADRVRMDDYLETIREVERRIQQAEASAGDHPLPDLDRPIGVPAAYADHARLMFDLQCLAYQGDVTRVITFQLARETSNRTYPEIGVPDPHHPLSHHGNDPDKIARMAKINQFHVSLFSEYVQKLRATPDGDGSLLDSTLLLYGSGIGNPNIHDHTNLPTLVAGGAATGMRGNRHIRYDQPTPLANLHLSLLDRVGVRLDTFADSDGKLEDLFPLSV